MWSKQNLKLSNKTSGPESFWFLVLVWPNHVLSLDSDLDNVSCHLAKTLIDHVTLNLTLIPPAQFSCSASLHIPTTTSGTHVNHLSAHLHQTSPLPTTTSLQKPCGDPMSNQLRPLPLSIVMTRILCLVPASLNLLCRSILVSTWAMCPLSGVLVHSGSLAQMSTCKGDHLAAV